MRRNCPQREGKTESKANGPFTGMKRQAKRSRNFGATGRTRCAIGLASPTSTSQTSPRAAGGRALPFPISRCRLMRCARMLREWVCQEGVAVATG